MEEQIIQIEQNEPIEQLSLLIGKRRELESEKLNQATKHLLDLYLHLSIRDSRSQPDSMSSDRAAINEGMVLLSELKDAFTETDRLINDFDNQY